MAIRRAYSVSSIEDCSVRPKVTSPTRARVGSRTRPNPKNAAPTLLAVATSPRATRPPETAARNMFARPVDSAIVAARAPWSTKCSVVRNVTATGRGSDSSVLRGSLSVAATPPPWRPKWRGAYRRNHDRLEEDARVNEAGAGYDLSATSSLLPLAHLR